MIIRVRLVICRKQVLDGRFDSFAAQFVEAGFHGVVERKKRGVFFRGWRQKCVDFERVGIGDGAEQHIAVIESACEAFGARHKGRQLNCQSERVFEFDGVEIARHEINGIVDGALAVLHELNGIWPHLRQLFTRIVGQRAHIRGEEGFQFDEFLDDLSQSRVGNRSGDCGVGNVHGDAGLTKTIACGGDENHVSSLFRLCRKNLLRLKHHQVVHFAGCSRPVAFGLTAPVMSNFKQAVARWAFGSLPIESFSQVFDLGVHGVEMPPEKEFDQLRDMGFTIVTVGGHKSLEDGLNKRENHARIQDEIGHSLEMAKKYAIPNLIVFSGNRGDKSEQEGAHNTIEGLNLVKGMAESAGVTLVLELLNSKVDHRDYQCDHTNWGVQVVSGVNSPRVKLLYDIYHMQIMEGDLIRTIRANIEHIGHFHTAGNPGRNDLDDNQEIYYPAIARAINELGYTGWVGHEYGPKKPPLESLKQAFDAFNV